MENSKVYFTNLRTKPGMNLLDKVEKLIKTAGMEKIDFKDKFTAIKIHFGEPGNLAYIRPNYVRRVAQIIQNLGGKPFLTDANTLYTGGRSNAVDHLHSAEINGFGPMATGCQIMIADGLKGGDYKEIPINQKHCKTAKIGTVIADADIIVSMNHFKGHEITGFGGAIKNIGMGSGSRGGKMEMHSDSKPKIDESLCVSCRQCIKSCAQNAMRLNDNKKAAIDYEKCVGCGQCVVVCMTEAVQVDWGQAAEITVEKTSEYVYAVLKGKPNFHINFIMNVSPDCDCWGHNDMAIVPDIGIAASFDPVALDRASADLVNQMAPNKGSILAEKHCEEKDHFKKVHPNTDWEAGLRHAESMGIGVQRYELIQVD